jgi:hypothetical protein
MRNLLGRADRDGQERILTESAVEPNPRCRMVSRSPNAYYTWRLRLDLPPVCLLVSLPATTTATIGAAPVQMMDAPCVASPKSMACHGTMVGQSGSRRPRQVAMTC